MKNKFLSISIAILILIEFSTVNIDSFQISPENDNPTYDSFKKQNEKYPENYLTNTKRAFTKNVGQLENDDILFYVQGGGFWFTEDGAWIELREPKESRVKSQEANELFEPMERFIKPEPMVYKRVILKQEFVGTSTVKPIGKEEIGYFSNYFYGNDSSRWFTKVPNYQEIYYEDLYDGIDLRYYLNQNGLKYDLIVHPGADVRQIKVMV